MTYDESVGHVEPGRLYLPTGTRDCRNRVASQIVSSFLHVTRVTYGMSVAAKVAA